MPKKPFNPRVLVEGFSRYKVGVQYIGSSFSGWASNVNARLPSVEGAIQSALESFVGEGNFMNFKGSSRTDAGVHALRNVFQVDLRQRSKDPLVNSTHSASINGRRRSKNQDSPISIGDPVSTIADLLLPPPPSYDIDKVRGAINFNLDSAMNSVLITDVSVVGNDFDARGSARGRTYMYRILQPNRVWPITSELDVSAMQEAANYLLGEQDFSTFRNSGCQSSTPYRNVLRVEVSKLSTQAIIGSPYSHQSRHYNSIEGGATSTSTDTGTGNDGTRSIGTDAHTFSVPPIAVDQQLLLAGGDLVTITITADAFLLKMVRNIVGVLVEIGQGKRKPVDMLHLLAMKDRALLKTRPAPGGGLYLVDVHY